MEKIGICNTDKGQDEWVKGWQISKRQSSTESSVNGISPKRNLEMSCTGLQIAGVFFSGFS